MIIIGLCGRSGSGKSTVADFWKKTGAVLIDADAVCHYVYRENKACIKELCDSFGNGILIDGAVNRPELAKRAYGMVGGISLLNKIAHKYILDEIETRLKNAALTGTKAAIIDAPLLFESGLNNRCDFVVAVVSSDAAQISRLKKRDGLSEQDLKKRLSTQLSTKELASRCDCVIYNNKGLAELRKKAYLTMFYIQLKLRCVAGGRKGRFYVKKHL